MACFNNVQPSYWILWQRNCTVNNALCYFLLFIVVGIFTRGRIAEKRKQNYRFSLFNASKRIRFTHNRHLGRDWCVWVPTSNDSKQGYYVLFSSLLYLWNKSILITSLTLRLLMSYIYIYGAPSKARNTNVVYIWTYVWQRWNSLFLFAAQCFNTESMQRGFLCHICV